MFFEISVLFELSNLGMDISPLLNDHVEGVDEWLDDDRVEEFLGHCGLFLIAEVGVVVVVIALVRELVEELGVSEVVHAPVGAMDERLLVNFVRDIGQQLVVIPHKGVDVGKERGHALGVKSVDCLGFRQIILKKLLEDALVVHVEDLIFESKEKIGLAVDRDFVLQELKKRGIVFFKADSEGSSVALILSTQLGITGDEKLC